MAKKKLKSIKVRYKPVVRLRTRVDSGDQISVLDVQAMSADGFSLSEFHVKVAIDSDTGAPFLHIAVNSDNAQVFMDKEVIAMAKRSR